MARGRWRLDRVKQASGRALDGCWPICRYRMRQEDMSAFFYEIEWYVGSPRLSSFANQDAR